MVADVKQRTEGRTLRLMTSDDYPAYKTAIEQVYGEDVTTTPKRPCQPADGTGEGGPAEVDLRHRREATAARPGGGDPGPSDLRDDGGAGQGPLGLLRSEPAGHSISFLEWYNATDRHKNAKEGAEDVHVLEGLAGCTSR